MAEKEKPQTKNEIPATTASTSISASANKSMTRIIFVHGDKGGTGKSMMSRLLADFLNVATQKVAIVEADTSNPDVQRTFTVKMADGSQSALLPCQMIDLRKEDGWMDMMNFCQKHIGSNIIVNLPGGIGDHLTENLKFLQLFVTDLSKGGNVETELWWTLNITHDAINLLQKALGQYGPFFNKVRVVCNLFWTQNDKKGWVMWHESPLKIKLENAGGKTVYLHGLNYRVSDKLFRPENIMPFSEAMDAALGERINFEMSERYKLKEFWHFNELWLADVFGIAAPNLVERHPEHPETV